jgi:tetratricopeptide (TPR) repeat protein
MHPDAAREFWFLASFYDKHDPPRGLLLHNLSGQEFFRAKDHKNAEAQYTAALKIDAGDVAAHIGRAEVRSAEEKYWDALDDLNRALKVQPENVDALRQRGRAWMQLGNDKNAQDDLEHAEALTEPDAAK